MLAGVAMRLAVMLVAVVAGLWSRPVLAQGATEGGESVATGQGDPSYVGGIASPAEGAAVPLASLDLNGWFVDPSAQGWAGADSVEAFQGDRKSTRLNSSQ